MTYESALFALADPTRRAIFENLREGPRTVGEIADEFPVSRAAVSQHLKVLRNAGLIRGEIDGPRVCYCADPGALTRLLTLIESLSTRLVEEPR